MRWDAPATPASPAPGARSGFPSGNLSGGPDPLSRPDAGGSWPAGDEGGAMSDFGSMLAGDALDEAPARPKISKPMPPLAPPRAQPAAPEEIPRSDGRLKRAEELARRLEASERLQEEKKPGFLGRLFGRKPREAEPEIPSFAELHAPEGPVAFTDPREALDRPDTLSHRAPETFAARDPLPEPDPVASFSFPGAESGPESMEMDDDSDDAPVFSREAKLSGIRVSAGGSEDVGPVVIQRQIQVPITLGKEELLRGATLRLTLEIQVEAEESEGASSDRDSQVA